MTKDTIIVSMTSWTPRINAVANAFNAVIRQIEEGMDVHCVLVLCTEEFPNKEQDLPQEVLDLPIEILWTERNTRSHKKLMPTMRKYPDNAIIVIDDDTCQVEGWLKTFIEDHNKYPRDIIFGQSTSVVHVGLDNNIYEVRNGSCYEIPSAVAYTQKPASGASGTLFPPHIYNMKEFYDEDLMMELSPTCDETWQWAFALMEGITIRALSKCNLPTVNPCDQSCSLIHTNKIKINQIHLAIANRFPQYKEAIRYRQGHLIVGMYSHDERLRTVHKTIESLYNQSIRPTKIILCLPNGQQELLSYDIAKYVNEGFVEFCEVSVNFGQNNKYIYPIIKQQGAATLIVEDNYIYPNNMVYNFWIHYLQNPSNVYCGNTKVIALDNNSQPMEYKYWGTHGRLYENGDGYKDQVALSKYGLLIPPSSIISVFNKEALLEYKDAGDVLLHCAFTASHLKIAKISVEPQVHSELEDECANEEQVNKLIKQYRVV